jgi:hypothetical protein
MKVNKKKQDYKQAAAAQMISGNGHNNWNLWMLIN